MKLPPVGPGGARPPNAFVTLWALENASSDNTTYDEGIVV